MIHVVVKSNTVRLKMTATFGTSHASWKRRSFQRRKLPSKKLTNWPTQMDDWPTPHWVWTHINTTKKITIYTRVKVDGTVTINWSPALTHLLGTVPWGKSLVSFLFQEEPEVDNTWSDHCTCWMYIWKRLGPFHWAHSFNTTLDWTSQLDPSNRRNPEILRILVFFIWLLW